MSSLVNDQFRFSRTLSDSPASTTMHKKDRAPLDRDEMCKCSLPDVCLLGGALQQHGPVTAVVILSCSEV